MTDDPYRELREAAERWVSLDLPADDSAIGQHAHAILALLAERDRLEKEVSRLTDSNALNAENRHLTTALRKSEERAAQLAEVLNGVLVYQIEEQEDRLFVRIGEFVHDVQADSASAISLLKHDAAARAALANEASCEERSNG